MWPFLCNKYISNCQVNALNIAAYDGFLSLAQILHETVYSGTEDSAGVRPEFKTEALIRGFNNRTFALKSGNVYINPVGYRRVNVHFLRLTNGSQHFQVRTSSKYGTNSALDIIVKGGRSKSIAVRVFQKF